MNEWRFIVPGPPLPWARARRNGKRYFTSPEQERYRESIRFFAKAAGLPMLAGPVRLFVHAFIAHRKAAHLCGSGDGDNYQKQVQDALQLLAFADDACVVDWAGAKRVDPEHPRLEVVIGGTPAALAPRTPTQTRCALRRIHPLPSLYRAQ